MPNGEIIGYNVYLQKELSEARALWLIELKKANETELFKARGELRPATTYYLLLSANNSYGEGPMSSPIEITTASGGPLDAPRNVTASVDVGNRVNVNWRAPSNPNGVISGYTIYFTRSEDSLDEEYRNWQTVELPTESRHYSMDEHKLGLRANTRYRLRITARNDLSEGPPSLVVAFDTRTGELSAPVNVSIGLSNSGGIQVSFAGVKDQRGQDVLNYMIIYTSDWPATRESTWQRQSVTILKAQSRIEAEIPAMHVSPNSRYTIRVAGLREKEGDQAEPLILTIPDNVGGVSTPIETRKLKPLKDPPL